jgi:hypothetical protein
VFYNTGDTAAYLQNATAYVEGCLFLNCSGSYALTSSRTCYIKNTVFHTLTGGASFDGGVVANCVFYGLTTGFSATASGALSIYDMNYFGSVTTHAVITGEGELTNEQSLTADPLTNASSGDGTLNEVAGGGVILRAAEVALGTTTLRPFRWLDAASSGGGSSYTNVASAKFTRLE